MTSSQKLLRPAPLRLRFLLTAAAYAAGAILFGQWLSLSPDQLRRWGAGTAVVLIFQLLMLWRFLPHNHRPGEPTILPTLGLGNGLTLTRGLLLGLLAGFLLIPRPAGNAAWLPVILYTTADLLDFCDGLAARLTNHVTGLGEKLDMELDGLGVGLAVLLVILYGQIGWWFLVVALARYLFVIGIWWRQRQARPIFDLTESRFRRLIAGYNMGFLTVALWPILTRDAVTVGAAVFVTPLLLIFWRDWLVVSGRLNPDDSAYQRWREQIHLWGAGWLPLGCRVAIAVTAVTTGVWPLSGQINPHWTRLLQGWGWSAAAADAAAVWLTVLALVTLIPVVLGIWARWLALVAILPAALNFIYIGLSGTDSALLGAAVCAISIVNSGRFSLYLPAEEYMYRRLG